MNINSINAISAYGAAKKTVGIEKSTGAQSTSSTETQPTQAKNEFSAVSTAQEMASSVVKSEAAATAFLTGNADPHSVVEAMASAELAVETAVTLRNRVVEAYQELLRMPV